MSWETAMTSRCAHYVITSSCDTGSDLVWWHQEYIFSAQCWRRFIKFRIWYINNCRCCYIMFSSVFLLPPISLTCSVMTFPAALQPLTDPAGCLYAAGHPPQIHQTLWSVGLIVTYLLLFVIQITPSRCAFRVKCTLSFYPQAYFPCSFTFVPAYCKPWEKQTWTFVSFSCLLSAVSAA